VQITFAMTTFKSDPPAKAGLGSAEAILLGGYRTAKELDFLGYAPLADARLFRRRSSSAARAFASIGFDR